MVAGTGPTHTRHSSRGSAETEAVRLARINPGTLFFVMEAVCVFRKTDVEKIEFRQSSHDDAPF